MRYKSGITQIKTLIKKNKRDIESGGNDIYEWLIRRCDSLIKEEKELKKVECSRDFVETGFSGEYYCYKCNIYMSDYFKKRDGKI